MKRIFYILILFLVSVLGLSIFRSKERAESRPVFWDVQSIDTMKYSRDPSREKLHDPNFSIVIAQQMQNIAKTGATHVAIATPYDEEFLPVLREWVLSARKNNLKVIFRGNWSGWEQWFGYPKIDRKTHIQKTTGFILNHPDLFEDGDIFMGCPECENGGPGDPRQKGDVQGYRAFLIDEHRAMKSAFAKIGKKVDVDYNSMNGDVARLVMDKATTKALGGTVVIDHYVRAPEQLASDIHDIADHSGGNVVLGEFGAPIPDITGQMTEDEQAKWLQDVMSRLVSVRELTGMNYWVNVGGSTSLYNDNGSPRKAVAALTGFYHPTLLQVRVVNPFGDVIGNAQVQTLNRSYTLESSGLFVPLVQDGQRGIVTAPDFGTQYVTFTPGAPITVVLEPTKETLVYRIRRAIYFLFRL